MIMSGFGNVIKGRVGGDSDGAEGICVFCHDHNVVPRRSPKHNLDSFQCTNHLQRPIEIKRGEAWVQIRPRLRL
jgi:hypothetical protein